MNDPEIRAWVASVSSEPWLMEPRRLAAFLASAGQESMTRVSRFSREDDLPFDLRDGVAHIPIAGVMLQSVPWWARGATSTPRIREALQAAVAEPRARAILLRVSSPGGSVAGVNDLADAVREARARKPVHAHAESIAASAAYWVGSQASRFTAEPTAEIGSIGAYRAIVDTAEAHAREGVKVHLVRSGPQKGTGHYGVPVSDAELAHQQTLIDGLADLFVGAVARGRRKGREEIEPSATGATWLAADAVKRGLIDGVEHADAAHQSLIVAGGGGDLPPARIANDPAIAPAKAEEPTMPNPVVTPPAPEASTPAAGANPAPSAPDAAALSQRNAELEAALATANASLATAHAKVGALEASILQLHKDRKLDAIDAAVTAGKIAPAQVPVWTKLAEASAHSDAGLGELKDQIAKLPRGTRPEVQGNNAKDNGDGGAAAIVFSASEQDDLRRRGKDPERIARAGQVEAVIGEGKVKLKDGRIVVYRDFLEGKAG